MANEDKLLAFVKACRADAEPGEVTPLSWLFSAIEALSDLDKAKSQQDEDPDAYATMLCQISNLRRDLDAAVIDHDYSLKRRYRAEHDIDNLYGCPGANYDTDEGADLMLEVLSGVGG